MTTLLLLFAAFFLYLVRPALAASGGGGPAVSHAIDTENLSGVQKLVADIYNRCDREDGREPVHYAYAGFCLAVVLAVGAALGFIVDRILRALGIKDEKLGREE